MEGIILEQFPANSAPKPEPLPAAPDGELSEDATIEALVGDTPSSIYSRLTSYLQTPGASFAPGALVNALLSALVALLHRGAHSAAARIADTPALAARAREIQAAANLGEDLLERHYARVLSELPVPAGRSDEKKKKSGPSAAAVAAATAPFPYVGNYVRMMRVECAVLGACARAARGTRSRGGARLAVCGAGPLPMSGALAAAEWDDAVTLIDVDAGATALSRAVVSRWTSVGALRAGSVAHVCADAGRVRWGGDADEGAARVRCEAVLVASLVPDAAKMLVARAVADAGCDGPDVLAVRSAHGLTAVANYDAAPRAAIAAVMDFVGYIVPVRQVRGGRAHGERSAPIALFPPDILNSLEIYARRTEGAALARRMREEVLRIPEERGGVGVHVWC